MPRARRRRLDAAFLAHAQARRRRRGWARNFEPGRPAAKRHNLIIVIMLVIVMINIMKIMIIMMIIIIIMIIEQT